MLKEVDRKSRDYLWGSSEDKRKMALASWKKVCIPKKYSGFNIKSCREWNIASVGKLLWQLADKQDMLWVKWVNGIYMKASDNIGSTVHQQTIAGIRNIRKS